MAADKVFGSTVNSKGYKVIKGCGVIQGDGIDIEVMKKVRRRMSPHHTHSTRLAARPATCTHQRSLASLRAQVAGSVEAAGFAADNVTYGMGGGLLQKVNRDTMSFATKLNHIVYRGHGHGTDIMKQPQTDTGKFSLPGMLAVKRVRGVPTVFPADSGEVAPHENMLQVRGVRGQERVIAGVSCWFV